MPIFFVFKGNGQEKLCPIKYNPEIAAQAKKLKNNSAEKTTKTTVALSLPFFDDFTGYSPFPDTNIWVDNEVYINNTMCISPKSRGVATLDDLNQYGLPYDTLSNSDNAYADSLTSQTINLDLSVVTPGDSIYLSFFYQPQGNGFYPLPQDSLMLYFKNKYGTFVNVWSVPGSTLQPFQQVLIPITDSLFFSNVFQFRFVNIAGLNYADAVWNVDYIKLDKNRNRGDSLITDIAFTASPNFLLNDYSYMPYNQFIANPSGELAFQVGDSIINDLMFTQNTHYNFSVTDHSTGSILSPLVSHTVLLTSYLVAGVVDTLSIAAFPTYPPYSLVDFQIKEYLQATANTGPTGNDTIVKEQIFDNYLAYDDGSAEQAYYLNLNSSEAIPGEIQIEYHLNTPDTLRGMAIYFARQIPLPYHKEFFVNIYYSLIGVNGCYTDSIIYQQQTLFPGYIDTINHFWIYRLDTPIVLPAGTFYAGTMQPAYSGSDSLYFGFDVNRIGANHAYYRVEGAGQPWNPSLFNGAIMIRPLFGHEIKPSYIPFVNTEMHNAMLAPNPANNFIILSYENDNIDNYYITDDMGKLVQKGNTTSGKQVDVSKLKPGNYFATIMENTEPIKTLKFVKL